MSGKTKPGGYAPPSFQMYARSYLEGCAHMTLAGQGAYMRLLCHQWERGVLPSDHGQLARLVGVTARAFAKLWGEIGEKFPGTPPTNPTLEDIRAKMKRYSESRKRNQRGGQAEHMSPDMSNTASASASLPFSLPPSERQKASESITPRGADEGRKAVRSRERNDELPGIERPPSRGVPTSIADLLPVRSA